MSGLTSARNVQVHAVESEYDLGDTSQPECPTTLLEKHTLYITHVNGNLSVIVFASAITKTRRIRTQ